MKPKTAEFNCYKLANPTLLSRPTDIPDDYIAYNPSAIWTDRRKSGRASDVIYVRVEPDRSCPGSSHLGKSVVRPYTIDVNNFNKPLEPYYDAPEIVGEDAALTKIKRRLASGTFEIIWLLSCIHVKPSKTRPDQVESLHTKFFAGTNLDKLEHIANGPVGMKDIRIAQNPNSIGLHIYGRPQPEAFSGNITYATVSSIDRLNAKAISDAKFIDEDLFPVGSGIWGGANDVICAKGGNNTILAHRAWCTGENGVGRHYESLLLNHDTRNNTIRNLGILATASLFPEGTTKADEAVDLHDVVFSGGGYNGTLNHVSFGVRDGSIGLSSTHRH